MTKPKTNTTPLWVIGSFVTVSEVVAGVTVINTEGLVQAAALSFMAAFTFFIAGAFFLILWRRSEVLFPPEEFRNVSIEEFVTYVGSGRENRQKKLVEQVAKDVAEEFVSEEGNGKTLDAEKAKKELSSTLASVTKNFLEVTFVRDFLVSKRVTTLSIYMSDWVTVADFLNEIYFEAFDAGIRMPPFEYGNYWILRREGGELLPIKPYGHGNPDNRPFEVLGLHPGDRLVAEKIKFKAA